MVIIIVRIVIIKDKFILIIMIAPKPFTLKPETLKPYKTLNSKPYNPIKP